MKAENINPYAFISKKIRVINTKTSPNISLKKSPPQRMLKNILSDLLKLSPIIKNPRTKFKVGSEAPIRIDLYKM